MLYIDPKRPFLSRYFLDTNGVHTTTCSRIIPFAQMHDDAQCRRRTAQDANTWHDTMQHSCTECKKKKAWFSEIYTNNSNSNKQKLTNERMRSCV